MVPNQFTPRKSDARFEILPKLVAPETDLNLARVVGKTVTQTEQNRVPPHDSSTETVKPSFRKS